MTGKRFNIHSDEDNETIWISDVQKHKEIEIQHYYGIATVVKMLNELAEENEVCKEAYQEVKSDAIRLKNENEQLKSSDTITDLETKIMTLKTIIQQLRTDNTKQKKKLNTAMKENEHIKQTLKDMIENERTELGKMTLRHLWRQIQ